MIVFAFEKAPLPTKSYVPPPEAVNVVVGFVQFKLFALVKVAVGTILSIVTTTEAVAVQPFAAFTVTV